MLVSLLAGVAAIGGSDAQAAKCTALPARSGTPVALAYRYPKASLRTIVRVCTGGKQVTLAAGTIRRPDDARPSGTYVGAASAAGRRVAWIEARLDGRERRIVVKVATVTSAGPVRMLREYRVVRDSLPRRPALGVVLTSGGDLGWMHSSPDRTRVVVKRAGRSPRVIHRATGAERTLRQLGLEDGRTLRWNGYDRSYGYFDLRTRRCPGGRSAFRTLLADDRVALTSAHYGLEGEGAVVVRGCDLATGRDRVLAELTEAFPDDAELTPVGVDRTWVLFRRSAYARQDDCRTEMVETVDVARGKRSGPIELVSSACDGPSVPPPIPGSPFAVTARGTAVWIAQSKLIAARDGTAVVLDQGDEISGLRAAGDQVTWTNHGVSRVIRP